MSTYKEDYIERINKVLNYINNNINEDLSLENLANLAYFSKYHFHRIFKSIMGETLNSYIKRIRMHHAFQAIRYKKDVSLTDIAYDYGFSSSSNFSTAFKNYYNITPSELKEASKENEYSNILESSIFTKSYNNFVSKTIISGEEMSLMNKVVLKEYDDMNVAYARHIGDYYKAGIAWEKITYWAATNNLLNENSRLFGISYDDPDITTIDRLRYDACIIIPENIKTSGEIGLQKIKGGLYATIEIYGKFDEIKSYYDFIFKQWLPNNPYEIDDRSCLEFALNNPNDDPEGKARIELCIPIKDK